MILWTLSLVNTFCLAADQSRVDNIKLERNGCFGTCPSYTVTIHSNGKVSYFGKEYVRVNGKAGAHLSHQDTERFFAKVRSIDFFSLKDSYDSNKCVTDGPNEYISVRQENRVKRIYTYCEVPVELANIEDEIDNVSHSIKWVFIDERGMKQLMSNGFDIANQGPTFMEQAVEWDTPDVVHVLARAGLDINKKNRDGNTYLMSAVLGGHYRAAKALLEVGANFRIRCRLGETPAINAGYRSLEMIRLFLDRHTDVNDKDVRGTTMLMAAASQGHLDSVQLLLDSGASINQKDNRGQSALAIAEEYRTRFPESNKPAFDAVIAFLQQHGGAL